MIEKLYEAGYFSSLDVHMARAVGRIAEENDPLVVLAMAVASRFTAQGHVCVDLAYLSKSPVIAASGERIEGAEWPDATRWLEALQQSPMVTTCSTEAPLVLDRAGRLYLARYWQYQQRLLFQLRQRSFGRVEGVDPAVLEKGLARLFPQNEEGGGPDAQRDAAETSVRRYLTVVTGGPGTGKTYTVVKMLMLILDQGLSAGATPQRILCAAPTGKAAARLKESITSAKAVFLQSADAHDQAILSNIPDEAITIHRLLGIQAGSQRARFNSEHPIPTDVLVVDEASMVDLSLMTRMLEAVPFSARTILLGDEDQLASVEAGAILGDICRGGRTVRSEPSAAVVSVSNTAAPKEIGGGLGECIVRLTRSYRFDEKSGIGRLAEAIRRGDADTVMAVLNHPGDAAVTRVDSSNGGGDIAALETMLTPFIRTYFLPYLTAADTERRLRLLNRFRILCAHRRGMVGVSQVNDVVERLIRHETDLQTDHPWYPGKPIMMLQNDYQLGLYNGDVGMIGASVSDEENYTAYFPDSEGGMRSVAPARLSAHETVYAMTVHKSQGSEFDHVLVILPAHRSPVVTRELLYTAVTRAKKGVTIFGPDDVIREAVNTPVHRASGLSEQLVSA